jgi:hypothetical protein
MIDAPAELVVKARLLAARYALGENIADRLKELADALIWADTFDDAVFEAQDREFSNDIALAFFSTLQIPALPPEQALRALIGHWLSEVVGGRLDPQVGLARVVERHIYERNNDGVPLGIAPFLELEFESEVAGAEDWTRERRAAEELKLRAAIVDEARRWLEQYPPQGATV